MGGRGTLLTLVFYIPKKSAHLFSIFNLFSEHSLSPPLAHSPSPPGCTPLAAAEVNGGKGEKGKEKGKSFNPPAHWPARPASPYIPRSLKGPVQSLKPQDRLLFQGLLNPVEQIVIPGANVAGVLFP